RPLRRVPDDVAFRFRAGALRFFPRLFVVFFFRFGAVFVVFRRRPPFCGSLLPLKMRSPTFLAASEANSFAAAFKCGFVIEKARLATGLTKGMMRRNNERKSPPSP
ncbi:MAG: hypothetical protein GY696_21160, partial [Gammaproteobacteria bacterium]|nr:hypothetical protein [Gammaproteobacteria bacterium]